jgi:hypothetical protein
MLFSQQLRIVCSLVARKNVDRKNFDRTGTRHGIPFHHSHSKFMTFDKQTITASVGATASESHGEISKHSDALHHECGIFKSLFASQLERFPEAHGDRLKFIADRKSQR